MVRIVALFMVAAVLVVSCSSDEPADLTTSTDVTSTTSEGGSTVTTDPTGSTTTTLDPDTGALLDAEMCRTLDLLANAGVPPSTAAVSITATDLASASSTEKADYSRRLIGAPARSCPQHIFYADEISYWLGY